MLRVAIVLILFATAFVFGQSFADVMSGEAGAADSFGHNFVLFLHELLLVYWLGPDIAVFIWSRSAVNPALATEQRIAAGHMMTMIDLVPRVCLALFLTVAGILSETYGVTHPWWQMVGIVLLGPVWLALVLGAWMKRGTDAGATLAKYDLWMRAALVVGIPISVVYSTMTGRLADTPWITAKLLILAVIILFGLLMRLRLRAFFEGIDKLESDGPSPEVDTLMATSLKRTRPFVHVIWLLLLAAALLGIVKPGEAERTVTTEQVTLPG
jgi:hypothetical protein